MKKSIWERSASVALALMMCIGVMFTPFTVRAEEGNSAQTAEATIEDEETALVATPDQSKRESSWWWMVVLGAGLGITIEEYVRIRAVKHEEDEEMM